MEILEGIEPSPTGSKPVALPLNYRTIKIRKKKVSIPYVFTYNCLANSGNHHHATSSIYKIITRFIQPLKNGADGR